MNKYIVMFAFVAGTSLSLSSEGGDGASIPMERVGNQSASETSVAGELEGHGVSVMIESTKLTAPSDGSDLKCRIGCFGQITGNGIGPVVVNGYDPFSFDLIQDGKKVGTEMDTILSMGPLATLGSLDYQVLDIHSRFVRNLDMYLLNRSGGIYLVTRYITGGTISFGPLHEGTVVVNFSYNGRPLSKYNSQEGYKAISKDYIIGSITLHIDKERVR